MDGLPNSPPPPSVVLALPEISGGRPLCPDHLTIVHDAPSGPVPVAAHPAPGCENTLHVDRLKLAFDDEFDTLRLYNPQTRQGVWKTTFIHGPQVGPGGWDSRTLRGNHEQEIYVDPDLSGLDIAPLGLKPFAVRDGVVSIIADKTPELFKSKLWNFKFTSGLLTTQPSFAQRYGYFEIRAKLPAGKGVWPAFWLLPTDAMWPPELDILEQVGGDDIYQTVHTAQDGAHEQTGFKIKLAGATTGFHTYGALWTPDRVVWFIDGKQTASAATPADMRKPMYILLNLAVGGGMTGDPDAQTVFPAHYNIDYVRAYSLEPARTAAAPTAPVKHAQNDKAPHHP